MTKAKPKRKKLIESTAATPSSGAQKRVTTQEAVVPEGSVTTQEPVVGPVAAAKKEKAPSFCASVRRILVRQPALTFAEVSQALVNEGWGRDEVERRRSTIATLRTDALAIISLAKEAGWTAPQQGQ